MLALMQSYMKMEFSPISAIIGKFFILASTFVTIKYIFPNPNNFDKPFLIIIAI
jgi:hypothetical protein